MPAIHRAGIPQSHGDPGKDGNEQDDRDDPVEQKEQSRHCQQGDPVLADLHQAVHEVCGPVGGLPLGTMERVVILRAFVILQVHIDGLGVEHVAHVVRDGQGLRFADQPRDRAEECAGKGRGAHQDHEQQHLSKHGPFVGSHQPRGHRVHHELHEIKRQ